MADVFEYPKIRALHYIERDIPPDAWVAVQPKLDGSNVAVRRDGDSFVFQSRTTLIDPLKPGMFAPFVAWVSANRWLDFGRLDDGEILYGEMLNNQGKIKYPEKRPFVLFDIANVAGETPHFFAPALVASFAALAETPFVGNLWTGPWRDCPIADLTAALTDADEGLVVKAYDVTTRWEDPETGRSGEARYPLLGGKVVRAEFREAKAAPSSLKRVDDPLDAIADLLVTKARVRKAVQAVREAGGDPEKGHLVIAQVGKDAHDEDAELVRAQLFRAYWKQVNHRLPKKVLALHAEVLDDLRVTA